MAEINITPQINITNGVFKFAISAETIGVTQNNVGGGIPGYVVVGETEQQIDLTELTYPGYCYAKNLDDTYYVQLGADASGIVPFLKLKPGEVAIFRIEPTATLMAISEAGSSGATPAVKLQLYVFED